MTKALTIFASVVLAAILLTDVNNAKFSCKNNRLAYMKASDYAVEHIVRLQSKNGEFQVPSIDDFNVEHSYMGDCRYYIKAFVTSDKIDYNYETVISGNKNDDNDDWKVEKFRLLDK